MTESQRTWFIRLGVLAGVILALLLLVSVIRNISNRTAEPVIVPPPQGVAPTPTITPPAVFSPGAIPGATTTPTVSPSDRYLVQLSRIVIERLGSFSNQNENAHIDDILPLVTDRMTRYIETLRQAQSNTYAGQTTRVVTITLSQKANGKATVMANVQRENSTATETVRTYPVARVELVEVSKDEWRVDGIFWE